MSESKTINEQPKRCRVGDQVMYVRGNAALLGRSGTIACHVMEAIGSIFPGHLSMAMEKDWVVDLDGQPVVVRAGNEWVATTSLAAFDRDLLPLSKDRVSINAEEGASV